MTDGASHSRAGEISPYLNQYDVVILNEAFVNKNALLSKAAHPWKYIPAKPLLKLVNSGLFFLSKFEIIDQAWEKYHAAARQDRLAAKGIGYVTLQVKENGIKNRKLQVFSTHMQAGDSKSVQTARRAQAEQAAAFVNANRAKDAVVVLCGDLNMGPRQHSNFDTFSVHYTDRADAVDRCASYEHMVASCKLREVSCDDASQYDGDICRFLIDGIEPEQCTLTYERLLGSEDRRLSDTEPVCLSVVFRKS